MYYDLMSTYGELSDHVRGIENCLDSITDPLQRVVATDRVRADLAVVLTRAIRRSAYEAKMAGRLVEMSGESWRGSRYLYRLAEQWATSQNLPNERVKDVISPNLLDLNDLARLRGVSR